MDDVEALAVLYPDCSPVALSTNACHRVVHNIGFMRVGIFCMMPLLISLVIILLITSWVHRYQQQEWQEARELAERRELEAEAARSQLVAGKWRFAATRTAERQQRITQRRQEAEEREAAKKAKAKKKYGRLFSSRRSQSRRRGGSMSPEGHPSDGHVELHNHSHSTTPDRSCSRGGRARGAAEGAGSPESSVQSSPMSGPVEGPHPRPRAAARAFCGLSSGVGSAAAARANSRSSSSSMTSSTNAPGRAPARASWISGRRASSSDQPAARIVVPPTLHNTRSLQRGTSVSTDVSSMSREATQGRRSERHFTDRRSDEQHSSFDVDEFRHTSFSSTGSPAVTNGCCHSAAAAAEPACFRHASPLHVNGESDVGEQRAFSFSADLEPLEEASSESRAAASQQPSRQPS